ASSEDDDAAAQQVEAREAGAPETEMQHEPAPEEKEEKGPEPQREERRPAATTRPPDSRPSGRPSDGGGSSKVLSPVVRRLIAEHDLDPDTIPGTGAGGRITRSDVLAVVEGKGGTQGPAP